MKINSAKDLEVYKLAFALSNEIFETSKEFPREETYALTDADGELNETNTWLDFALSAKHINPPTHTNLSNQCRQIGAMLGKMIHNPDLFIRQK